MSKHRDNAADEAVAITDPGAVSDPGAGMAVHDSIEGADPIDALLTTASDLRALLDQETEALKALDAKAVQAMQPRKQALSGRYITAFRASIEKIRIDGRPPQALGDRLRSMESSLAESLERNVAALDHARTGSERLIKLIVTAARRQATEEQHGYGASAAKPAAQKRATSISVNTTL